MKNILILLVLIISSVGFSQVIVNNIDINNEADSFEVWAFIKPFNTKECLFANYGQNKFRPVYYDHKTQRISNAKGEVFKKGMYLQLVSYLKEQGWEKTGESTGKVGNIHGRVITFNKVVVEAISAKDEAILKLKEAKELLDLEVITQEEYDKIKEELTPIIRNN